MSSRVVKPAWQDWRFGLFLRALPHSVFSDDRLMTSALSPPIALSAYADAALVQAVSAMRPGWIVLRHGTLDLNGASPPARTQYALLHRQVGIALLDVVPGTTARDAAQRLKHRLDAAGFHVQFRRNPPIRYLCVPLRAIHEIERLLAQEFGRQSSSVLPEGDAWVAAAQRLLVAEPLQNPSAATSALDADNQRQRRACMQQPAVGHRSNWPLSSARWLGVFWGLMAMTVSGGGLLLQYLGPLDGRAALVGAMNTRPAPGAESPPKATPLLKKLRTADNTAPSSSARGDDATGNGFRSPYVAADARDLIGVDPQRAIDDNDQAILALQKRLGRFKSETSDSHGAGAVSSETPTDRVLPIPANAVGGVTEDLSEPSPPFAEMTTPIALPISAISIAEATLDLSRDTPAPARPDAEASLQPDDLPVLLDHRPINLLNRLDDARRNKELELISNPLRSEKTLESRPSPVAAAAVAPEQPAVAARSAPAEAMVDAADIASVLPTAETTSALLPGLLLPRELGASTLPAKSISTMQPANLAKGAPFRGLEVSPLLSSPIAMLAETMVRRADTLLQRGDVSGARLLYERAAAAGSGGAAMTMGKTFDAMFLAGIGVTGMGADPATALIWYRRAAALGNAEASARLLASMRVTSGVGSSLESQP